MGNVLRMDKKHLVEGLIGLGWSNRRIERETKIHRITIAKYRLGLQNDPQVPAGFSEQNRQNDPQVPTGLPPADSLPVPRNALLLPHVESIRIALEKGLTAQRIDQDLFEDAGYRGSYDSIKRYVRKLRKKVPHFFERLPVLPGHEAQVDFSQGPLIGDKGNPKRRSWLFKMTLSYSRHAYEELVFSQDTETFLRCHMRAFAFFGGVPRTVKIDNLKSGVLKAHLYEPVLNPVYASFAKWHGFLINPCDPYQPQQKGRVERDIAYTQSNALKGRDVLSLEEGNRMLAHWNKHWARLRIHGTTKRQVWQQFISVEQSALSALPQSLFPFFKVGRRRVDIQGHVEIQGNHYSAPYNLIGTYVTVHFNSQEVLLLVGQEVVSRHKALGGRAQVLSLSEHRPPHRPQSVEAEEHLHLQRARVIGPNLHRLVDRILSKQDMGSLKRVRGIMGLRKEFQKHLEDAAGIALARYNHSYSYTKSLCEALKAGENPGLDNWTEEHDLIRNLSEYQTHVEERMN